jgi:ATP-dependent exoDNAse (exonuclease V) alpha subunit
LAIYHLSVKPVSRSAGRSATAAAAYRAGCQIVDKRTGEIYDYTRKGGVESADIVLPDGAPEWATDRAKLWNAAELAEKRKDACVAREFEVALPSELCAAERRRLALDFAKEMANREGCAVDVAIHAPGRKGDNRNHHAHILRTTRKVGVNGLGEKLDTEKAGRKRWDDLEAIRTRWADMTNERLRENGVVARVDHRSLEAQGIEREPTIHLGPQLSGLLRRGARSYIEERLASERLEAAMRDGAIKREISQIDQQIIELDTDIQKAKAEAKNFATTSTPAKQNLNELRARSRAAFAPLPGTGTSNTEIIVTPTSQDWDRPK